MAEKEAKRLLRGSEEKWVEQYGRGLGKTKMREQFRRNLLSNVLYDMRLNGYDIDMSSHGKITQFKKNLKELLNCMVYYEKNKSKWNIL